MPKEGTVRKLFVWGTFVAGAVAAYLMYKRGESMPTIAKRAITNPVGSFVTELRGAQ